MPQCDDCMYEWDNGWVMVDGCQSGCECEHPPSYQGTPGTIVTVPCNPEDSLSASSRVMSIGVMAMTPWYRTGDEKHSIMRRTEEGWRHYYYGHDRLPKIGAPSELFSSYPVGALLLIGADAQILGIGMMGKNGD